jgi:hypothetical protein
MSTSRKAELHNIQEDELNLTVWRYLTFPKFIHLITYGALWFCRLQELIDEFEGRMPEKPMKEMKARHQDFKKSFPDPKHHWQFDQMAERNVSDGRSLSTMNIKTPACINQHGKPFSREDVSGSKMNNFDNPGLLVGVNLPNLFEAIVLPPTSLQWFKNLIIHISNKANYGWSIEDSKLK